MRILVVDDSLLVRARLATLLAEAPGVRVEQADSVDAALALVRLRAVDVVILDLHMPDRSGLEALVEIKQMPQPPFVVVWTVHPTEPSRRRCMQHGADLFLDKSKDFHHLLELLAVAPW
jgi:DNA-binding NarL/FixJ family response regulator